MNLADWLDYHADVLDGIAAGVADDRQRDRLTRDAGALCRRALVADVLDELTAGTTSKAEAQAVLRRLGTDQDGTG